uniref:Uncharacterized protein n=1 Tax=Panagrolaimus sp. PS1159 TaxID=55785 RepID=A0AC35G8Z5_9BILA
MRQIVAAACLTEILREDLSSNQHVSQYFVKSGNVNSILSSLRNLKIDFNHILDRKNRESCSYFVTIMSLFTRLASTNCGWNALIDYLVVPTVSSLKFWKDIPRGFFTGKEWNQSFETAEGAYTRAFECFMQFCLAMASNPYWKTISCPLLEAIERNQELTNQLIRTHPTLSLTKMIALLVFYIHNLDDNAKEPIETTKCLNDLLLLHTNGAPKTGFELTNLPTRSAFNLPLNLFTKRS